MHKFKKVAGVPSGWAFAPTRFNQPQSQLNIITQAKKAHRNALHQTLMWLSQTFPKIFFLKPEKRIPLKLNILVNIQQYLKGLPESQAPKIHNQPLSTVLLIATLKTYTEHDAYLKACCHPNAMRIDLAGEAVEPVSALHVKYAMSKVCSGTR